ncbi:DNA topoisomerase-3 [Alkalibaculum bacchi]|uniref:DNA topoisomerase n=1 Tax=Alkalibaculum bacchi TaxID=645887 RepID=A0A366I5V0_9FIRM|nr:type IA DNA topoisomerase [Alkalibaculum bacchi]RBP62109.1 DNA topoisomerase-3 [Alkalibaculum bacchi]
MKVIIAEKPSVAKNIADAVHSNKRKNGYFEGNDYLVTWAFGHLLELLDAKDYDSKMSSWRMENYPFIPQSFEYKVKSNSKNRAIVDEGAFKQIELIKELINKEGVNGVISACDYDREGQIIGDIILEYLHVNKSVERLLLNEWTPTEVKAGLEKLKPNSTMEPLRDAGISRQWADWVIGINLTSVATLKYQRGSGRPLNIGRVLLPTLKIIYDRDMEIEQFKPEAFYKLMADFKTKSGEVYEGIYTLENKDKFPEKALLQVVQKAIKDQDGIIIDKQVEKKKEYPPSLFNLSNLQGHVTSKYKGWTSDKVLKIAQSLYEKKFITYPRTASMALEESLTSKAQKVLNTVKKGLAYEDEIVFSINKRVFDNSKVESHSAIIPTYLLPKGLDGDEKIVYEAVKNRFIMQFMPIAEHEEATLVTKVDVEEAKGTFISKGRIQLTKGWKKVEDIQSKDKTLPMAVKGDIVHTMKTKIQEKKTLPPKKHTEKTLLRVMETCGKKYKDGEQDSEEVQAILSGFSIGTPATRAETIKKLETVGYIERSGKNLTVTDMGKRLVEMFPVKELLDLEYTGRLEKSLSEIEKGQLKKQEFLNEIFMFTTSAVDVIKKDEFHIINEIKPKDEKKHESLGKCPLCKSDVIEGTKGYGCSNWKAGCKFVVWKNDKFLEALKVRPTKEVVIKLLEEGKVYGNHFISKKGKRFTAYLYYEKNKENDYFSWRMEFPK